MKYIERGWERQQATTRQPCSGPNLRRFGCWQVRSISEPGLSSPGLPARLRRGTPLPRRARFIRGGGVPYLHDSILTHAGIPTGTCLGLRSECTAVLEGSKSYLMARASLGRISLLICPILDFLIVLYA